MADLETVTVELEVKPGAWFPMGKHFWQILDIDEAAQTALVIAAKEVCQRAYHGTWTAVTWETCDLRKWLNGDFLETEFSIKEQEAILETAVKNPDNKTYKTKGGNDTKDKIFLLSLDEVRKYFQNDIYRATGRWWWLRSPGTYQGSAADVYFDGTVSDNGHNVGNDDGGIRPAFHINLLSVFFQSLNSSYPESKIKKISKYKAMFWKSEVDAGEYRTGAAKYRKLDASTALTETDHEELMRVLKQYTALDEAYYAPYAVYADEKHLAELIAEMKAWPKEGKAGKERVIRVRGAILLNETNDAMRYADSLGLLGRYAKLRGLDEDTLRDTRMDELGLDEDGRRSWMLAGKTYTAVLNPDLTLSLLDESGKVLRSLPKKDADPEAYAAADKELKALKKDLKPTAKQRNAKIFADFLSGAERRSEDWKKIYLHNPLLRLLAQRIVWEQDGKTFTLKDDRKAYDVNGAEVEISSAPVRVAHPMEMGPETTEAWQQYFTENGLAQPFEQVWEPVVADASLVKPGRYDGCTVPLYLLMNKDKHGIVMEGQSRIDLKGCSAGLRLVEGHHDWINNEFEITDFRFDKFNRQVNHIVCYLDKATVAGRIKKDDVSVLQWLHLFTVAQIMEFIDLAGESGSVNVQAILLQYKQEHFADFDPMAEFTLDLL